MDQYKYRTMSATEKAIYDAQQDISVNTRGLAYELWAVSQLSPGEGIMDGVTRVERILKNEAIKKSAQG